MDKNYILTDEKIEELNKLLIIFGRTIYANTPISYQMHQNELIINVNNEFQFGYNDGCEVRLVILNGQHEFDEVELTLFEEMRGMAEEICDIVFIDDEED